VRNNAAAPAGRIRAREDPAECPDVIQHLRQETRAGQQRLTEQLEKVLDLGEQIIRQARRVNAGR